MKDLVPVYVASPFRGETKELTRQNIVYAQLCMLDALARGEAPYLSHLLYTQTYAETPALREIGLRAGDAWRPAARVIALYVNLGVTSGMERARDAALFGQGVEERRISLAQVDADATVDEWRAVLAVRQVEYFQELIP